MTSRTIHTLVTQEGEGVTVDVCHEDCTQPHHGDPSVAVFIEDPTQESDTITQIALLKDDERKEVHVYWRGGESRAESAHFHLILVESTSHLFTGAGNSVAVLDYDCGVFVAEYRLYCLYGLAWRKA